MQTQAALADATARATGDTGAKWLEDALFECKLRGGIRAPLGYTARIIRNRVNAPVNGNGGGQPEKASRERQVGDTAPAKPRRSRNDSIDA